MKNKLHLILREHTIDIAVNFRGTRLTIKVDGREYTSIRVYEGITIHTMGVRKPGLREPGDEEDVYEIAVYAVKRSKLVPLRNATFLNLRKNGKPVHAEFTRKNSSAAL